MADLKTKHVCGDKDDCISGEFVVEAYQRGYRWGDEEVGRLIDDIDSLIDKDERDRNYCLQPIVVKPLGDKRYELIDGQQRLTTLYIILNCISEVSNGFLPAPKFSLDYRTRKDSSSFLKTIDPARKDENIDFFHIANAHKKVTDWVSSVGRVRLGDFYNTLGKFVSIIWYEVDETEDSSALFQRLNIGKIPLTSSELVKAKFLGTGQGGDAELSDERKNEIVLQWDTIEQELHDVDFWGFLTNSEPCSYPTRIDILLDLVSRKERTSREKYFTFFYFDNLLKTNANIFKIWQDEILHSFMTLKDWFQDHDLYHKIGYLIASDEMTLQDIFVAARGLKKSEFASKLDGFIMGSVKYSTDSIKELRYDNSSDYKKLSRILLLFNVESVRTLDAKTQRFAFGEFKLGNGQKLRLWSLEHIHAQQSEGLRNEAQWREWFESHRRVLEVVHFDESSLNEERNRIVAEITKLLSAKELSQNDYERVQAEVARLLSVPGQAEDMHTISNLALLDTNNNAALGNSVFAVKRNKIIEKDKKGEYIPFCTKMVFLKYYTKGENSNFSFWSPDDRKDYLDNIFRVIGKYLPTATAEDD